MRAQLESNGHRRADGAARLLAAERERPGIVKPAREHVSDGLREDLRAVEVEELARARGHEPDVAPKVDPPSVEGIDPEELREQPVAHLGDASRALVLEQLAPMLGILHALVLAPATLVPRDERTLRPALNRPPSRAP